MSPGTRVGHRGRSFLKDGRPFPGIAGLRSRARRVPSAFDRSVGSRSNIPRRGGFRSQSGRGPGRISRDRGAGAGHPAPDPTEPTDTAVPRRTFPHARENPYRHPDPCHRRDPVGARGPIAGRQRQVRPENPVLFADLYLSRPPLGRESGRSGAQHRHAVAPQRPAEGGYPALLDGRQRHALGRDGRPRQDWRPSRDPGHRQGRRGRLALGVGQDARLRRGLGRPRRLEYPQRDLESLLYGPGRQQVGGRHRDRRPRASALLHEPPRRISAREQRGALPDIGPRRHALPDG